MSDLLSSAHKLESFVLMAKSAKGAGAAKLIENATSAPGVFVFRELLDSPNVQELSSNPQLVPYLDLLKLFSYGTYEEYKLRKDALPSLNPPQLIKLKNLSIVSLASQSRILPYADLRSYLDVGSIRELEDLIIDAMYQDVLRGRLDQKEQQLEVEYTMGRDLRPGQLEELLGALKHWSEQTSQVINALDTKMTQIAAHHEQQKIDTVTYDLQRNEILTEIANARRPKRGGTGFDMDEMDIDIPSSSLAGAMGGSGTGGAGGSGVSGGGMGFLGGLMGGEGWRKKKPATAGQSTSGAGGSSSGAGAGGSANTRKRNRN